MSFCMVTASATLPPMVPYPFTPTLIIVEPSRKGGFKEPWSSHVAKGLGRAIAGRLHPAGINNERAIWRQKSPIGHCPEGRPGLRGQQACDERAARHGSCRPISYVLACLTMFQNGSGEVELKARGRAISKAVDAALIVIDRFVPEAKIEEISIDTEHVPGRSPDSESAVSSMRIRLTMPRPG
ncbi:MAG TPA: hypothetical protein VLU99_03645 [Nitrososphaerales archaeon]|nr:hypothetical protein [Nitrososphaerales archaeon]